mmetsp:Transcript_34381/g.92023  ORF Transcript_34381/g.92023 Transcript_34381/m.92023 type:complete len:235 (-) Transcript_34381:932-1636(-)
MGFTGTSVVGRNRLSSRKWTIFSAKSSGTHSQGSGACSQETTSWEARCTDTHEGRTCWRNALAPPTMDGKSGLGRLQLPVCGQHTTLRRLRLEWRSAPLEKKYRATLCAKVMCLARSRRMSLYVDLNISRSAAPWTLQRLPRIMLSMMGPLSGRHRPTPCVLGTRLSRLQRVFSMQVSFRRSRSSCTPLSSEQLPSGLTTSVAQRWTAMWPPSLLRRRTRRSSSGNGGYRMPWR